MDFFQTFVLSLNLLDLSVHCYIVRLPCMLYGRFLIRYDNYYYPGKIIEIQGGMTEPECSISCISNGFCSFYNYFKQNKTCSLLSTNLTHVTKGMLVPMTDASFISTNYSSDNVNGNRGLFRIQSTSKMELFAKIVNGFQTLSIFANSSILNISSDSECAS